MEYHANGSPPSQVSAGISTFCVNSPSGLYSTSGSMPILRPPRARDLFIMADKRGNVLSVENCWFVAVCRRGGRLGGARRYVDHTGRRGGHIVSPRAQLVIQLFQTLSLHVILDFLILCIFVFPMYCPLSIFMFYWPSA